MRRSRGAARVVAASALLVAAAVTASTPAAASGSVRSTTTLHVGMSANGRQLVLTATVAADLGTPSGSVAFVDDHHHTLGVVALTGCPNRCTAVERLRASSLGHQVNAIIASYAGNSFLKSSAAATPMLYERCTTKTCASTLHGSQTSVGVGLSKGQSALATLGGPALPCSIHAGQVVNLATTGPQRSSIQVVLYEAGAAGSSYLQVDDSTANSTAGHSAYRCIVSATPFTGFSPSGLTNFSETTADFARYGTAPKTTSGHDRGAYFGLIADCYHLATHAHTVSGVCENLPKFTGPLPDEVLVAMTGGDRVSHFVG